MDKEHRVSVYDMVKELNLKEVTPEINSKKVYIEQAEINRYKQEAASLKKQLEEKLKINFPYFSPFNILSIYCLVYHILGFLQEQTKYISHLLSWQFHHAEDF